MALQHFYSRIPSRVSMFNKADSFDTFALSDGLSREFIERELSRIYENRPGLNESDFIRRGELPPAYCQITVRSGELIQSCISFISKDYTGERSSYLVHSIVFSEEEKSKLLRSENERLLDKSAFLNNYDNFNVTDDNARPITDYPQKVDFARQIIGVEKVIDYYDANMLKRFIYTVLSIACGKGKNVFVILPDELSVFSDRALDLMESIMQILPFRLRDAVSFVTYTGDWAKYQSFKIKFLTKDNAQIPPAKGWILDFGLKTGNESLDKEVSKEIAVVDFFYGLLKYSDVRREFMDFSENAVNSGRISAFNFKTLSDLVFLFKCSCGMFDDKTVVPNDDAVYELFCVYDKYCEALKTENRIEIAKKLQRYPKNHQVIPKTVFSKLSKLYRGEPEAVKRVYMNAVLDLIHTDIMREKLFAFIKNNYAGENEEMRVTINGDLCRVFYGGFLQPQILAFFTANFSDEPIATRDLIVDKILLVIRTKALQDQIFEFIRLHFGTFTENQKERLFSTVYEMLPYGDELSRSLIGVIDGVMVSESDNLQQKVSENICLIVENEQKKREHPFFESITASSGFCAEAVTKKILTEWSGRKIYRELIESVSHLDWNKRTDFAVLACRCLIYSDESAAVKFFNDLSQSYLVNPVKGNLFAIIDIESRTAAELGKIENAAAIVYGKMYAEIVLAPIVENSLFDIFRDKFRSDGVAIVKNYVQAYPSIKRSERFAVVNLCFSMIDSAVNTDEKNMIAICEQLPSGNNLGQMISEFLMREIGRFDISDGVKACADIISQKLSSGKYLFNDAYNNLLRVKSEKSTAKKPDQTEKTAAKESLIDILSTAAVIYRNDAGITSDECDLKKLIVNEFGKFSKKEKADLEEKLLSITDDAAFCGFVSECVALSKNNSGGFFARLFGRK